ncbi:hypothetical protein [Ancylobacter sp. IITR112]|uniref:D-apionate lactonase n=1 Tax=Ancylobacter sp. IITR112 TaxID=3138073 RepID=UPI00352AD0FD
MSAAVCPEARRLALFGTAEPEPETRRLEAGPLSAELIAGNLRNIRFHGIEVLRAISFLVRDADWGTYAPALSDLFIEEGEGRFTVRYRAACVGPGGERLVYHGRIEGTPARLVFEGEAVPEGDFLTNRCGFTILHPIVGLAGSEVEVEHVDGTRVPARLPELIDPAQPFKDMRAITHTVAPGVRATCRMEGDTFEMEDQRNWSDASYKTYVRPLALPWPYVLPAGVPLRQRVTLDIAAEGAAPPSRPDDAPVTLTLGAAGGRLPDFGLVIAPDQAAATLKTGDELAALAPQSLLLHFDPTAGHGPVELVDFARLAAVHGAEAVLEYVVPCARPLDDELGDLARQVAAAGLRLDALAVSPAVDRRSVPPGSVWPPCPPLEKVYEAARRAFPGLRLGGGMFSYFTELNRKRPPVALLDYVTHCICPIVHDADDRAVMQTLEALPFILRSARAIIGADKPYRLGPSTIGMRHNPYGARVMPNPERRRLPMAEIDPRQDGLFAAAYLVGMAARLAEAGVESFTGAALTGPFGLLAEGEGEGGAVRRPVFHAARWLAAVGGAPAFALASADPARVLALAGATPAGDRVMLAANLTPLEQAVGLPFGGRALLLDESAVLGGAGPRPAALAGGCLTLPPYAVLRLEG